MIKKKVIAYFSIYLQMQISHIWYYAFAVDKYFFKIYVNFYNFDKMLTIYENKGIKY